VATAAEDRLSIRRNPHARFVAVIVIVDTSRLENHNDKKEEPPLAWRLEV
jgi:hypothetical protein